MNFLKHIKINTKIYLLIAIPLVFLTILASINILNSLELKNKVIVLKGEVVLANKISLLVHETQKERGMTAGYLASSGKMFADKLIAQRELTNKRMSEIKDYLRTHNLDELQSNIQEIFSKAMNDLSAIEEKRTTISAMSISANKAISYYTNMNEKFLNTIIEISTVSPSAEITQRLVAYSNFLLSKERAGIERAVGSALLAKDKYNVNLITKMANLIAAQNTYLENFMQYGDNESTSYYKETVKGSDVEEVNKIRDTILNASKKKVIISEIKTLVGYGGFIHNFKNYVIKSDEKYKVKVINQYKHIMQYIAQYKKASNITKDEKLHIKNIEDVLNKYYAGIANITQAIQENSSIRELDKVIKVNDSLAIKSILVLDSSFFTSNSTTWFSKITGKINLLKKVDDHLSTTLIEKVTLKVEEANNKFLFDLTISLIALFSTAIFALIISRNISTSVDNLSTVIHNFLSFLNREKNVIEKVELDSNDEIGQVSKLINDNIDSIANGIENDMLCVGEAVLTLDKMQQGHYECRVLSNASNPQVQTLAKTINSMLDVQENIMQDILEELAKFTQYDFTKAIELDPRIGGETKQLVDGINTLRDAVTRMLIENKQNGLTLQKSSNTLLSNMFDLNNASNQAAASLEETAAAVEEVTSTITNNTSNVIAMASYAAKVTTSVNEGQELANQTTSAMEDINHEVSAISDSISVIDQIAFQTNILSLNAAVEAATAGEAGKGFAVVAQEVRNLAARSADAANEIKELVEKASSKASTGKDISTKMTSGYHILNENISKTIELINDVETASKEQQAGITQINDAITQLDAQTQKNAVVAADTEVIASNTQVLSRTIVENVNSKQFVGKDLVTAIEMKEEPILASTPKSTSNKPILTKAKEITPIKASNNDDEWASF